MNSTLHAAREALAQYDREVGALASTSVALEKSIADSSQRLADLEVGIGAPDKVSDWLKLKSSIMTQIDTSRAELAKNQAKMTAIGTTHAQLAQRRDDAIRYELISYATTSRARLEEGLAIATKAATALAGLNEYLRGEANANGVGGPDAVRLHRFANENMPALPKAVLELGITGEMCQAAARSWSAMAGRLRHPEPEIEEKAAE